MRGARSAGAFFLVSCRAGSVVGLWDGIGAADGGGWCAFSTVVGWLSTNVRGSCGW